MTSSGPRWRGISPQDLGIPPCQSQSTVGQTRNGNACKNSQEGARAKTEAAAAGCNRVATVAGIRIGTKQICQLRAL